jgi:hypothetical protein
VPQDKKNRDKKKAVTYQANEGRTGFTSLKRAREYESQGRAKWIVIDSVLEFIPDDHRNQAVERSIESDVQAKTQQRAYELAVSEFNDAEAMRTFAPYPETGVVLA